MSDTEGVGTELAKFIPDWAVQFKEGCKCRDVQAQMNRKGTQWCRDNELRLVQHLLSQDERLVTFLQLVPAPIKKVTAMHYLRKAIAIVEAREAS